jgi:hypothetical protein
MYNEQFGDYNEVLLVYNLFQMGIEWNANCEIIVIPSAF